jgi:hypothetical protein
VLEAAAAPTAGPASSAPPGPPAVLALIDELGKGTEVAGGTALAGALLEELAAAGATGVFATHLHLLAGLPLDVPGLVRWRMGVEEDAGWRRRRRGAGELGLLDWELGEQEEADEDGPGGGPSEYPLAGARGWVGGGAVLGRSVGAQARARPPAALPRCTRQSLQTP